MRITGELNNAELKIGKRCVGFNPSAQALNFEDILNLISAGGNIQGKGSEISLNPAVPFEGSLGDQGQRKEVSRIGKDQKSNNFPINLSIFGLVVYGQVKQALEEGKVKADNALATTDIDLPIEEKVNTSLVQFSSSTRQFTEPNKEEGNENNGFLVGFIVKPVEGKNTQVSNLFNVCKECTQIEVPDVKINAAPSFAKVPYQIKSIENLNLSIGQNSQNFPNVNQADVDDSLRNNNVEPLLPTVFAYDAPVGKDSYTSVEKDVAKNAKLEIKDNLQTKELIHRFFDGSELEFYPKEEHTEADLSNSFATTSLKVAKNGLEDLPQRVEKSELLPMEKSKKEEEHSHLYNTGVPPQRFEDKIENVQEVKNTKYFHTFHDSKSLYVKLEEGDFRIRVVKDAISVKVDFREDFRPPTVQEVQNLIESLSKVGFRMEVLSLNGKNLQWEFRQGQEDKRGNRSREASSYQGKNRQEFSL